MTSFFRELDRLEEADFRQWARDNYTPNSDISPIWHPVVRDECKLINAEQQLCDECNAEPGVPCRPYCACWGCVCKSERGVRDA